MKQKMADFILNSPIKGYNLSNYKYKKYQICSSPHVILSHQKIILMKSKLYFHQFKLLIFLLPTSATRLPGGNEERNPATLGQGLYLVSLKCVAMDE